MNILAVCGGCVLGALVFAPVGARAQTAPTPAFTVLPPPAIDAPGAKAVVPSAPASSARAQATAPAAATTAIPIPALPNMHLDAPRDARGQLPPTVKVIQHKGQTIEEYYEGGQLYMVQVHPKHGVTYSYFVNKAHDLTRSPGAPKISPVLYTLLEWGKPDKTN